MKLSGELDYRIRYDVEHDLFHAQNVFSDEYITPTFVEYVQNIEKENAELKERIQTLEQIKKEHTDYTIKVEEERTSVKEQLTEAKELLKQWLQTSKASGCDNINIVTDTEQFLKDSEVEK